MGNIGKNYDDFTRNITNMIIDSLNNTEEGREVVNMIHDEARKKNPNFTAEEWDKIKPRIVLTIFMEMMNNYPELRREMAGHLYNELRAEGRK